MPRRNPKPAKPTHRANLATGETVDYAGAHPTHWSFGGIDENGQPDGSPVRNVPVTSVVPLEATPDHHAKATADWFADVDDEDDDG